MGFGIKVTYSIAKKADEIDNPSLTAITIPSGKYAVFSTDSGSFAGDVLPKLRAQIFDCWLPDTSYKQKDVYEVDVNHASKSPLARSFKASVTQEKGQRHGAKGHIKTLTQ